MTGATKTKTAEQAPRIFTEETYRPVPIAYPPAVAAVASGRTRTRIFGAIRSGELMARKDGKATIIEHDELMRWVKTLPVIKAKAS